MELDEECKECLYRSQLDKVIRTQRDGEKVEKFKAEVKLLCAAPPAHYCAPLLMRDIDGIHRKIFGSHIDYSAEKRAFNGALLAAEGVIRAQIEASDDPLRTAVSFAMAANYIDFARWSALDEKRAAEAVFTAAERAAADSRTLSSFKEELQSAATAAYFHDNCGEIVLDKILIATIRSLYPRIAVTSVVRGGEIINDATPADARQVGLSEVAEVIDSGSAVPGTVPEEINAQAFKLLRSSDVVIAKGLGNLETLYGRGYSIYYMFMCKCEHIARRFHQSVGETAFVREEKPPIDKIRKFC